MRWTRLFVVLVIGLSTSLVGAGVARADSVQSVIDAGDAAASSRGTTAGIAVLDRVTGRYNENGPNAHQRFGSASLVKLFIADSVLRRAQLGQLTLTSADRSSLTVMLRSSNDAAASSFWSRFGSSGIVTDVTRRYHLNETLPPTNARYWGLTQVTAHDLVAYYQGMLAGTGGLAAADRDFMVDQLRHSTAQGSDGVYQWFGLHDGLPGESVVGVKQGWMCCFSDGYIWRHSTGIIGPDARYVVVVLTRDRGSLGSAHTAASATRTVQAMYPGGAVPRVQGDIGELWYRMGGAASRLGMPTTSELALPGGAMNRFVGGDIYWSPGTGAHWVIGAILGAWNAGGAAGGRLGYPTSDELALTGGALSRFQGGYVYWTPSTGAHWVVGAILGAYGATGWERGPLGYPTSDELALDGGGATSRFQHGNVYWTASTGAHWLTGDLLTAYTAAGGVSGRLGYPIDDPHAVTGGGTGVDFQHGSLTRSSSGKVVMGGAATAGTAQAATRGAATSAAPSTAAATSSAPRSTAPSTASPTTTATSTVTATTTSATPTTAALPSAAADPGGSAP